jgi:D-beta-D-heptose 7-phosphate kinase / D-beta-D-heptose 1-phosphate adenosyltransferase
MLNTHLQTYINAFSDLKVLVIGDAMLDSYLKGSTERLCREAPVPVISLESRENVPGGAGNAAVNIRSLGARVFFLSVIGSDPEGDLLLQALESYGVPTGHIIRRPERQTLAKQRLIATSQMLARFDQGSVDLIQPEIEDIMIRTLEELFPQVDAILVSDYDYGLLTPRIIQALADLQTSSPRLLLVDSRRLLDYSAVSITAIKPNFEEASHLLGLRKPRTQKDRLRQIEAEGSRLLDMIGTHIAAITLDRDGALVYEHGIEMPYRTYTRPAPHTRAAGAGDTFMSALALSLAAGAPTEHAADIASAASSIVVEKDGTSACHQEELIHYFSSEEKLVTDVFQLAARLATYRRDGRRIVFTNGCFDILHRGHISYLNRAKSFGDILIIGLNSDESVRRLKGASRPINPLEDRGQILAALSCVDHIVPFEDDTSHNLIRIIQPDVYVKGGDYTHETLPEARLVEELGGKVEILHYLEDHSTTSIIERIRDLDRIDRGRKNNGMAARLHPGKDANP